MPFRKLSDLDLAGKRVFIRADLNVPLDDTGTIGSVARIHAALPAIRYALAQGAAVMLSSHLGRPHEGETDPHLSLAPVAPLLAEFLNHPVRFQQNWLDGHFELEAGELVLLENCRFNRGEKQNTPELAARIAKLCDVYVNDSFATAHRAECTTHALALAAPVACAGPLLSGELEALERTLDQPQRPLLAVVGGSKASAKLAILNSLAEKADQLILGGGIANTFLLASGCNVGKSLVEPELIDAARDIIGRMQARGASLVLPEDVVVAREFAPHAQTWIKSVADVGTDDMILDIGPETASQLAAQLLIARSIVWNGPLGVFEFDAFAEGTRKVGQAIAESSATSLAGGGDTLSAIARFGLAAQIDYISTAGGAFLEYLEGKPLPTIEALRQRADN